MRNGKSDKTKKNKIKIDNANQNYGDYVEILFSKIQFASLVNQQF